jgi:hypothetical protein
MEDGSSQMSTDFHDTVAEVVPMRRPPADWDVETSMLAAEARALAIVDQQSYETAGERLKGIVKLHDRISKHHETVRKSTYKAWQDAIATEKNVLTPVIEAEDIYRDKINVWEREQKRLEAEARARAEAEARRLAEEQRETEIEQAEAEGADVEEIAAMARAPLPSLPVTVQPTFERMSGISTADKWIVEVYSLNLLLKAVLEGKTASEFVTVNISALKNSARSSKGTLVVPGVRFINAGTTRVSHK